LGEPPQHHRRRGYSQLMPLGTTCAEPARTMAIAPKICYPLRTAGASRHLSGMPPPAASPNFQLTTDRLLLRRWDADADLDDYHEVCSDPEVMRYIGDGTPARDPSDTAGAIDRYEAEWDEYGFGLFAVELRRTGELIGFVGLSHPTFLPDLMPVVEIGWRLGRRWWGQGLATEGARAVLDWAFNVVGVEEVVSIHQVGNDPSARIMQKLGMTFEQSLRHPKVGRELHVYRATAPDARVG
jgi:RimJ/RimL family protein N-acetyltransferase